MGAESQDRFCQVSMGESFLQREPMALSHSCILYFRGVVTWELSAYVGGGGTIRFNVIHEESSENSVLLFSG
jgi:hypothetical protein